MYSIKGRISETANAHWVVEYASDIEEAISTAKERGMYEIYSAGLTKIRETFRSGTGDVWWKAKVKGNETAQPTDGGNVKAPKVKAISYSVLVLASTLDEACHIVKQQMEQGYDMVACQITDTDIDDVIN